LAIEVGFALHYFGGVGFVNHEKIRLIPVGPVAMSDVESGNASPFRHVLTIMPFEIFELIVGIDIGPKRQQTPRFGI
jgi:hypothetical protein